MNRERTVPEDQDRRDVADGGSVRLVCLDDQPLLCRGLAHLCKEHGFDLVTSSGDIEGAVETVRAAEPRVVVLDIDMADEAGLTLLPEFAEKCPQVAIVILTMQTRPLVVERALQDGAAAYLLKTDPAQEVAEAILRASDGRFSLSHKLCTDVVKFVVKGDDGGSESLLSRLSTRELEIFLMTGRGMSTRQIASRLHRSAKTVHTHKQNIRQKLDLENNTELVHFATQWCVGPLPEFLRETAEATGEGGNGVADDDAPAE